MREERTWSKIEEEILEFWQKNNIFQKILFATQKGKPYVFYDGPPFANGTPHYGHIEQSFIKDAVARFFTMNGQYVERVWGWDCHGLPAENFVEKELGLKSKKDIESYGIQKFNDACRESVLRFASVWKKVIPRIGRWVQMEDDYKTMDTEYIESLWWVFSELFKKGYVYQGRRSIHICPRCETTLSNMEVADGYKDIEDISATVKFELKDESNTFILAWTTTPWTLPGNVALAVGENIEYVKISKGTEKYILAKANLEKFFNGGTYEILETLTGKDLAGKMYLPLFDFFEKKDLSHKENGWKIYTADFVSTFEGTGVVHIAPAFGEDDMNLGQEKELPFLQHVRMDGTFVSEIKDFPGEPVKPKEDPQKTDRKIIECLQKKNLLFKEELYSHSYPHCWRCDTPLLNYATNSWFVSVTKIKENIIDNNQKIHWTPEHIKNGRMGKWLEGVRDWSISRGRFWGTPLPVWKCDACDHIKVLGSLEELPNARKLKNNYILMRHGEATHNISGIISCQPETEENRSHLTLWGKTQIHEAGKKLQELKVNRIVRSPMYRLEETAEILREYLGNIPEEVDERLKEIDLSSYNCGLVTDYDKNFSNQLERFHSKAPQGGETLEELQKRMVETIEDLEKKFDGETILVLSHGDPLWMLEGAFQNKRPEEMVAMRYPQVGKFRRLRSYSMDPHRPKIDEVKFSCECGGTMKRIPDVFDCWFESGSMPYASFHYPFKEKEKFLEKFPADFVVEANEQTRLWFYVLLVLGTALFERSPYQNAIASGIILAEDGKKMSKKLKNYPELEEVIEEFGVDPIRLLILGSPLMKAETMNFSKKGVDEMNKKVVMILRNVVSFYKMYVDTDHRSRGGQLTTPTELSILDQWIFLRLNTVGENIQRAMEEYDLNIPIREILDFTDDLSTWYVRRSRERVKEGGEEQEHVLWVLYEVLLQFSKYIAPFTPFLAEYIYKEIGGKKESVHLEQWPDSVEAVRERPSQNGKEILEKMAEVREIVSMGLAKRAEAGVKVRQPLLKVIIFGTKLENEYSILIQEELNVLNVEYNSPKKDLLLELDTDWKNHPELVQLGLKRELVRHINSFRKEMGLTIGDHIEVGYETSSEELKKVFEKFSSELQHDVLAQKIIEGVLPEAEKKEIAIDQISLVLFLKKI